MRRFQSAESTIHTTIQSNHFKFFVDRNVAEALVSKGLASVVKYRPDDDQRSSRYDELLTAESKAIKSQVGIHNKKEVPAHRVTEIDAARAKLELSSFQRAQKIDAVVEFVASGTRLRLFIPKSNSLCTFLLGELPFFVCLFLGHLRKPHAHFVCA